jgi:hypothetical protein
MTDKNDLISEFSNAFGNSNEKTIKFANKKGILNYNELIEEFKSIQKMVYNHIYKLTEPDLQLTAQEIETICYDLCVSKIDWINSKGISAINKWLIWMCWHEGILKKD